MNLLIVYKNYYII